MTARRTLRGTAASPTANGIDIGSQNERQARRARPIRGSLKGTVSLGSNIKRLQWRNEIGLITGGC